MKEVMSSLGYSKKWVVDAKSTAGGLCLLWNFGVSVDILEFNKNLIPVKITDTFYDWVLVGFYGPSYATKKAKAWLNLSALLKSLQCLWVYVGDFNYTISNDEKMGGSLGNSSTVNHLRDLMFGFSAIDSGFSGNKFTWAKGKWGSATVKRRLDRGIASISWRLAFPKATISHLGAIKSDHSPLLLDTCPSDSFAHRLFRFKATWMRDPNCFLVIENAWNTKVRGSVLSILYKKQEATCKVLHKWNKEVFGLCQTRINSLVQQISEVQRNNPSLDNGNSEEALQSKLEEWLTRSKVL